MLSRISRRTFIATACFVVSLVLALVSVQADRGWHFAEAEAKTDRTGTYDLAKARMLARVVGHIRAHYVAPERVDPKVMAVAAMERVQTEVPEVRVQTSYTSPKPGPSRAPKGLEVTVGSVTREFALDKVNDLYELNWKLMDVFEFLEKHLPPQADLESLEYAAINGILSTLDPHTILLPPRVYRELQLSQKGRFGGLGITVGDVDGALVIQGVMKDTPAAEAGIAEGDTITQIGGESAVNMALDEAVNLLRGEPGSQITLWLRRDGWPTSKPFQLMRREIQIPSVESQALGKNIGYVVVRGFQESTDQDMEAALDALDKVPGGLKGLVLDLRDNPGGLLDKAIAISDIFLSSGTVVTTVRDAGKEREETHATLAETRADLPVVVLVNKGSASASEIVAGALKRNDRALIVGQRTFGKGSVQVVYRIDEAALKLTIAQYLTPGDVSIQGVGIVPDIDLETVRVPASAQKLESGLDLHPVSETSGGEASLASHLSSDKTKDETPAVILRLLDDAKTPTNRQPRGAEKVPDASVLLAMDILQAAPAPNRKQALVQLSGFLGQRQLSEDQKITAALQPFVDWKDGPEASPKTPLDGKLSLNKGEKLAAGKKVTVELTLTNNSKRAIPRVLAELESGMAAFSGHELAFGTLEAGQTVTKALAFTLPGSTPAAGDRIVARLYADNVRLDYAPETLVAVTPREPAVFGHSVQVLDPPSKGGNGDGLLQRGEKATISVWVTNLGQGPAEALLATLKNQAGPDVYLSLGRRELGRLEPGKSAEVTFELEVLPTLESRIVELELSLSDQKAPGGVDATTATIALPVYPEGTPPRTSTKGLIVLGSAPTPIHAGANRDTPLVAEGAPNAILAVRARVGDWFEVGFGHDGKRIGWIPAERGRVASEGAATEDSITPVVQSRPVVVHFEPVPSETDQAEITLQGTATFGSTGGGFAGGEGRRVVYVFRGRQKIWFGSAETKDGARDALPFKIPVALDSGKNDISVYAREGDGRATRTVFIVYKTN